MPVAFLHPALLLIGLACAAIPILVHLLRRRYKPVSWGAMRFLEHALKKRRRRVTIEQLVLLALRVLVVVAIAFAVGSILLPGPQRSGPTTLVVVLDNSIHAQRLSAEGTPTLETLRALAQSRIDKLDPAQGDRAALITLASPARADASPPTGQTELVRRAAASAPPTDAPRDTARAAALVSALLDASATDAEDTPNDLRVLVLTTDRGWTREALAALETINAPLEFAATETPDAPNAAVTSAVSARALLTPDTNEQHAVLATLAREPTGTNASTTVRVTNEDGSPLGARTHSWAPGATTASVVIPIAPPERPSGAAPHAAMTVSIDDDANRADNARHLTIAARSALRVAIIERDDPRDDATPPSRWVRAVLDASGPLVERTMIEPSAAAQRLDPALDAVVVLSPSTLDDETWSRLASMRSRGVLVLVTPDQQPAADLAWIPRLAPSIAPSAPENSTPTIIDEQTTLDAAPPEHPMLRGIRDEFATLASPVRVFRRAALPTVPDDRVLIRTRAGDPLLVSSADNTLVLSAAAFHEDWTDLPARPLFVALLQELLRRGVGSATTPQHVTAGADEHAQTRAIVRDLGNGLGRITRVVNPDTSTTTALSDTPPTLASQTNTQDTAQGATQAPPRTPVGAWVFAIALLLAALEFVMARRCSLRLRPIPEARP